MHTEDKEIQKKSLPNALILVAAMLVLLCGIYLAFSTVMLALDIMNNPENTTVIKWMLETTKLEAPLIAGELTEGPIKIEVNQVLVFWLYGILGIMFLSTIGGIITALITASVKLLRLQSTKAEAREDNAPASEIK